jgi:hypothetical protein
VWCVDLDDVALIDTKKGKNSNLNEAKTLCAHVLLELHKPEEAIEMISSGFLVVLFPLLLLFDS